MRTPLLSIILLLLMAGCTHVGASPATPTQTAVIIPTLTQTPFLQPTHTSTSTVTSTPLPQTQLCSPLEGVELAELPHILSNPFQPPRPGYDDGHHGADFAYYRFKERVGMAGLPIHSVMDGRVAAVSDLRLPYGYLIIIETPLEALPPQWLTQLHLPQPEPTVSPAPAMICPEPPAIRYDSSRRSLYLLYAHMQEASRLQVGQSVRCGQPIGLVGTTGESVQEHLHLETRVGPSGVRFYESIGFYGSQHDDSEAGFYCLWRVSGLFQMFNPLDLLTIQP